MPLSRTSGSKIRRTAFSPNAVGIVLTRSSTSRPTLVPLDPAVLWTSLLGEVGSGQELDPGDHGVVHDPGDHVHVVQDTVDSKAHQRELALGLEVDVGSTLLEGVGEDRVERLDDRRRGRVEVGVGPGEELLVAEVDRRDAALGQLLLRVRQARLEVVETPC